MDTDAPRTYGPAAKIILRALARAFLKQAARLEREGARSAADAARRNASSALRRAGAAR